MHYKFLDSMHVPHVIIDGTIIISSFEYFRGLEQDKWGDIADPLEAASELRIPRNFVVTEGSGNLAQLNSAGIGLGMCKEVARVESGGKIDLSGVRFLHQMPNAYIFSASWGLLNTLKVAMCEEAERKYSACLKIKSLHRLDRRIFEDGHILELDRPFRNYFNRGERGIVVYEGCSNSLPESVLVPSALTKDSRFKRQSEARITFAPKMPLSLSRLTIRIPRPSSLFEIVF